MHGREKHLLALLFPSVRPPACIICASTGRFDLKFEIRDFYEKKSYLEPAHLFKIGQKMSETLHEEWAEIAQAV